MRLRSTGRAREASWLSGSRTSGSSGKNRGAGAAAQAMAAPAMVTTAQTSGKRRNVFAMITSERGLGREDQAEPFVALRKIDPQRRHERAVKAEADAIVALDRSRRDAVAFGGDAPGVVEEREVEKAVGKHAPVGLHQQAVAIPEAPAVEPAQRGAAAECGQHVERNNLSARFARHLDSPVQ